MSTAQNTVTTGYEPRTLQKVLHRKLKRFNVLVMHRRFGKSVFAINEMIDQGLRLGKTHPERRSPRFAYLAPTYGQAKRVMWDYLKHYTQSLPGVETNEADLRVDIPRTQFGDTMRIMLLGAENPMALKGIYLDGTVLDEYGEMNPVAWREVIRPTLSDRDGWGIFIGTPKGQNHFAEIYDRAKSGEDPNWFAALYRASETGIIAPAELEALKREMTEEEFEQEFECSFLAGLVGAYWGRELTQLEKDGKFTTVPYDPAIPVDTFWDLGMDDVTSIWFAQRHFSQWRFIEYMQAPDTSIPEWIKKIRDTNYLIGKHHLPHDIKVRELGTGKTRLESFKNVGLRNTVVVPRVEDKLDSIAAARLMLPRCVFDATKCKVGIDALKKYQRKWDSKQNAFSPKPLHNAASNGADAFQTFAMGAQEDRGEDRRVLQREYSEDQNLFSHSGGSR